MIRDDDIEIYKDDLNTTVFSKGCPANVEYVVDDINQCVYRLFATNALNERMFFIIPF